MGYGLNQPVAIVLAAGKGTRMASDLPKVLHSICGRPMIEYVLDAVRAAGVGRIVVVVGFKAEQVEQALAAHRDVEPVLQREQHGTGHAVMMAEENLRNHDGPVLVVAGDTPLLEGRSLAALLQEQRAEQAACVIGTAETDANQGLGRIVRDEKRAFLRIVEERDATPEEAAIREINTGCYVFDCNALFHALKMIRPDNQQGELYLTDCPAVLKDEGRRVIASCRLTIQEAMGVNTPGQLAEVERLVRMKKVES